MIKMIATFGVVYAIVFGLIELFRTMKKSEKITLAKSALYSSIIAAITAILLTVFVYLF